MISVFTPSHDPTWLERAFNSLVAQTHKNFEWVVVANGWRTNEIRDKIAKLAVKANWPFPVNIVPATGAGCSIGELKRLACDACKGDIFVELDHDDELTPDALEKIQLTRDQFPGQESIFIYSDTVTLQDDGKSRVYGPYYGWTEPYQWGDYIANKTHPITPRSLCEILYAPDHVRAWTRKAYYDAGGHDPAFAVADDHDLMIRTYLAGAQFVHYNGVLYLHHVRGTNTSDARVPEIQAKSHQLRDQHLHRLIAEWCRRENLPSYDLGGYHNCPAGFIPIDGHPGVTKKGGIHCDLTKSIPLESNTVGCIRASDFLEHIPGPQVPALMNEIYRVLIPGGYLITSTPAIDGPDGMPGRGAFQDPTHVSYWSTNNWWYYTDREFAKYVPEIKSRFQTVRLANTYPSDWHKLHRIPYVVADLAAIKDDRYWPGPKLI